MGKHYSAYCFAWPAIGPLYDLSELAGCMNPKSVMEVILLPHVAMVVSKQHNYVIETLPLPIKHIDRNEASAALSKTNRDLSSPTARLTQDKHNPVSLVNACVSVRIVRVATGPGRFCSGVATAQMRTCYGSRNKCVRRRASHRISRDHPERRF